MTFSMSGKRRLTPKVLMTTGANKRKMVTDHLSIKGRTTSIC